MAALTVDEKIAELREEFLAELVKIRNGVPSDDDPNTKWIVFYEPIVESQQIVNPATGKKETVAVAKTKEHRVPLDVWPEYERVHGWA